MGLSCPETMTFGSRITYRSSVTSYSHLKHGDSVGREDGGEPIDAPPDASAPPSDPSSAVTSDTLPTEAGLGASDNAILMESSTFMTTYPTDGTLS